MKMSSVALICVMLCLSLSGVQKAAGFPVTQEDETVEAEAPSTQVPELNSTERQSALDMEQRIQACGDRLPELINIMCRQHQDGAGRFYRPETYREEGRATIRLVAHRFSTRYGNHIRPPTVDIDASDSESSENELIPHRRLPRQVARECCHQSCSKKDLLKYCEPARTGTSEELVAGNLFRNTRRQRRGHAWELEGPRGQGQRHRYSIMDMGGRKELQKGPRPVAKVCTCPKKHRSKASRGPWLPSPSVYIPYPMVLVPYGNNIPHVEPEPLPAGIQAFLPALHKESEPFLGERTWAFPQKPPAVPTPKKPREAYESPLFLQRALPLSRRVSSSDGSGQEDLLFNRIGSDVGFLAQTVTDAPYPDPIVFPDGRNDY